MKKITAMIAAGILMILLASCTKSNDNGKPAYDIAELTEFFAGKHDINAAMDDTFQSLTFDDVNKRFPVEEVKADGYSVYPVEQGGNYYVFWAYTSLDGTRLVTNINDNPSVGFSAYISSSRDQSMFDSLEIDVSTAADVMAIDPAFELILTMSSRVLSYSYLDGENLLQIEYHGNEFDSYDDLVAKEITVVPRDNGVSRFGTILPEDLPS